MNRSTTNDAAVYIVDDEFSVRDSLQILLQSSGYQTFSYESADSFLINYDSETPACLILDVRMPNMTGLELQEKLLEKGINIPIIFISGNADIPDSSKAFRAGALDFLEKPFDHNILIERIGEAINRDLNNRLQHTEKNEATAHIASLTPREKEVLELIVNSHTNKEVAKKLDISYRTVDAHRARVMQKMRVESITELVALVTKYDLLETVA